MNAKVFCGDPVRTTMVVSIYSYAAFNQGELGNGLV